MADPTEAKHEYGVRLVDWEELPRAHAIVAAVAHRAFKSRPVEDFAAKLVDGGVFADVKAQAHLAALADLGFSVWRL
jgi:UDP-N-acetyl-D-galactosamine dehydrogenase